MNIVRGVNMRPDGWKPKKMPNGRLAVREYLETWLEHHDTVTQGQLTRHAGCHSSTAGMTLQQLRYLGVLRIVRPASGERKYELDRRGQ